MTKYEVVKHYDEIFDQIYKNYYNKLTIILVESFDNSVVFFCFKNYILYLPNINNSFKHTFIMTNYNSISNQICISSEEKLIFTSRVVNYIVKQLGYDILIESCNQIFKIFINKKYIYYNIIRYKTYYIILNAQNIEPNTTFCDKKNCNLNIYYKYINYILYN